MKKPLRALFLILIAATSLLLARPALAIDASVRDEASFFGQPAIARATAAIQQIKLKHNKDLMVETFPGVPNDSGYTEDKKAEFFRAWAEKRASQIGVNGVYILITKEPGHIEIAVGNETQKRAFTVQDRSALRDLLIAAFKQKDFDGGLTKAADYVRDTMDRNLGARTATATPTPYAPYSSPPPPPVRSRGVVGSPCVVLVLLGIGIVVVIAILRAVFGGRGSSAGYGPGGYGGPGYGGPGYGGGYGPGPGYGPGYGGGGGGFMRGMFGGLLGGVAGGYLYDKLSGRENQGYSQGGYQQGGYSNPTPGNPVGGADPGGVDTSWSSSGGDFNSGPDTSSGPEAGGGFTSSDSGGGDSGGGGGDSGGGGGGDF